MSRGRLPLLVVDGYNVIWGTQPYHDLIDEDDDGAHSLPDVARLSRDPYGHDPFERAREALVAGRRRLCARHVRARHRV
ncbi:MAG: hypothetical protein LKF13_03775 [Atopobiaceae bacterium]|nr:hypothetical protein [Atopobiaceae bacterium]